MSKKKIIGSILLILFGIALNVMVLTMSYQFVGNGTITLELLLSTDTTGEYQLFYWQGDSLTGQTFQEGMSVTETVEAGTQINRYGFEIPADTRYIRMDFGTEAAQIRIEDAELVYKGKRIAVPIEALQKELLSNQVEMQAAGEGLKITALGEDPYLVWNFSEMGAAELVERQINPADLAVRIIVCLMMDLILIVILKKAGKLAVIPKEVWQNRKLILQLSRNDFKTRYAGSYLGIFWAFVQPVITILVYWFVFEKGLKAGGETMSGGVTVPFVLFLVSGIIPWFFFSDALNGGTGSLTGYSFLVKKVVFNISILPIIKVIAAFYVHLFFLAFALCLFAGYGFYPDLYTLQIVYYTFALFVFVLGLSYLTCSIVVFFKDLSEIINIILQIGIWITPVMWNLDATIHSHALKVIFKLNPLYYIVAGYRDSLINKVWFWQNPGLTIYYWIVTMLVLGAGLLVFRRLKVHFADVL